MFAWIYLCPKIIISKFILGIFIWLKLLLLNYFNIYWAKILLILNSPHLLINCLVSSYLKRFLKLGKTKWLIFINDRFKSHQILNHTLWVNETQNYMPLNKFNKKFKQFPPRSWQSSRVARNYMEKRTQNRRRARKKTQKKKTNLKFMLKAVEIYDPGLGYRRLVARSSQTASRQTHRQIGQENEAKTCLGMRFVT